jgi:hypothetical protein
LKVKGSLFIDSITDYSVYQRFSRMPTADSQQPRATRRAKNKGQPMAALGVAVFQD